MKSFHLHGNVSEFKYCLQKLDGIRSIIDVHLSPAFVMFRLIPAWTGTGIIGGMGIILIKVWENYKQHPNSSKKKWLRATCQNSKLIYAPGQDFEVREYAEA